MIPRIFNFQTHQAGAAAWWLLKKWKITALWFFLIWLNIAGLSLRAHSNDEVKPLMVGHGTDVQITIFNEPLNDIPPLLFGQFCEHTAPKNSERGAEAAWDESHGAIRSDVLEKIRELRPGLIRFPGGTQVDHCDWTAFIANAPMEASGGVRYRFGVDDFIKVCRQVHAEPLLVVNFRDGLTKSKPLAEAALQAAGLVAYCNAEVGAKLPEGMPDWPSLRAKNGSQAPFGVKYFQIGNESWFYDPKDVEWKLAALEAYIDAMRQVDPSIQIIADAYPDGFAQLCRQRLGDRLDMVALHSYLPFGSLEKMKRDGQPVVWDKMTAEESWLGLTSTMPVDPVTGLARIPLEFGSGRPDHGYALALTEWNWNGWGTSLKLDWIRAFGAANYLHAMMREPKIKLATQSMLIGTSWGINAIRVNPDGKMPSSFIQPVGAVTGFYAAHHGRQRLRIELDSVPKYRQPLTSAGGAEQGAEVAAVDVVATSGNGRVWVHVINRQFNDTAPLKIRLEGFADGFPARATLRLLQESGSLEQGAGVKSGFIEAAIPPRTIACLELE
jgi:alpha-L-arabinofuranosidase